MAENRYTFGVLHYRLSGRGKRRFIGHGQRWAKERRGAREETFVEIGVWESRGH